jgi:ATP-dependent DNA helicase DinG
MLPLIRWAQETKTGDIEEQNQFNIKWFARIWHMICADAHLCGGRRCPDFNACFLQNARMRAFGSHIVVINHALFFSELCADSSFLGSIGSIVFDEAHHIESCGHKHLRVEADSNRFSQYIDTMAQVEKELKRHPSDNAGTGQEDLKSTIKLIRAGISGFTQECNAWVTDQNPSSDEYQMKYPQILFSTFASYIALAKAFSDAQQIFDRLLQSIPQENDTNSPMQQLKASLHLLTDRTSQLKADLEYLSSAALEDHVFWMEGNRKKGWIKLCGVPLDIGTILSKQWENNTGACIFTSATLAVSRSLDYFMQKTGLTQSNREKTRAETFESPFNPGQTFNAAIQNIPEPDSLEFPAGIATAIAALMKAFGKNILVLFTSNAMLESVYTLCRNNPDLSNATLLAQGITGPRSTVLDEFKNSERSVLFGADSFWEGIDVPGKACEIVIIPRLPFQVPTHPLTKAISEKISSQNGESFFSYSVPEAIIKFRQGTGRLIRSSLDRGVMLVMDKRILTKNYGKKFSKSLKGELNVFDTIDDMLVSVKNFFDGSYTYDNKKITYIPFEELQ